MTEVAGPARATLSPTASSTLLTFLIADVRGYTRFTTEQGDEAAAQLAGRFAELTEEVVCRHDGQVVEIRGDEALCVFPSARNALRASVAVQAAFRDAVKQNPTLPLNVGIGLDAGEAVPVSGGYRGGALNLAARLCSIAGSGEIFSSDGVIHLARKTEGIAFVDRGEVTLKGLSAPVRVIQIGPEGELPEQLPPLQPILVTHPNNLPDDPTPFIGREPEIEQIAGLLRDPPIRMVTLTGPGGTGKTRLALQVGGTLLHDFRDGVFFVNLAPLSDPILLPSAIADVLGVQEQAGTQLLTTLTDFLRDKHLLLVLDNFEHLLDACSAVAQLLDTCRDLHVLITSRIPLHLSREHEHAVAPLSVPALGELPDPDRLSQYESVALFTERAKAAQDTFAITNDTAPAVAEICYRLDGLPLAIELAAARIKLFPPQALLQRLSSRLRLLTGGAKDRPARLQTLRKAIDWSYDLLSGQEQTLFARLSVFVGGCTFEAAEVVCNPDGELDLFDPLAGLVDKSLVQQRSVAGEPRFLMLETIKEYAAEKLVERREEERIRATHAAYFTGLAEAAEPELRGAQQTAWLTRLEQDHENLRTALHWSLHADRQLGLRLAGALGWFWFVRGHWSEGRRWLEAVLTAGGEPEGDATPRAKALHSAGVLAMSQDNYEQASELLEECLRVRRNLRDTSGVAESLRFLAIVTGLQGDFVRGRQLREESLRLYREEGDTHGIAASLSSLGSLVGLLGDGSLARELLEESLGLYQGLGDIRAIAYALFGLGQLASRQDDYGRAEELIEESLQLWREMEDRNGIAFALGHLGYVAHMQGEYERAEDLTEEALRLKRELGERQGVATELLGLGLVALEQGDWKRAKEVEEESLRLAREIGDKYGIAMALTGVAAVAGYLQEHERAAELLEAAYTMWTSMGTARDPCYRRTLDEVSQAARGALGEDAYEEAQRRGRAMSLEEAVAYALGEDV